MRQRHRPAVQRVHVILDVGEDDLRRLQVELGVDLVLVVLLVLGRARAPVELADQVVDLVADAGAVPGEPQLPEDLVLHAFDLRRHLGRPTLTADPLGVPPDGFRAVIGVRRLQGHQPLPRRVRRVGAVHVQQHVEESVAAIVERLHLVHAVQLVHRGRQRHPGQLVALLRGCQLDPAADRGVEHVGDMLGRALLRGLVGGTDVRLGVLRRRRGQLDLEVARHVHRLAVVLHLHMDLQRVVDEPHRLAVLGDLGAGVHPGDQLVPQILPPHVGQRIGEQRVHLTDLSLLVRDGENAGGMGHTRALAGSPLANR